MVVLFHGGAAAGGVDDDGIDIGVEESIDVAPGHLFSPPRFRRCEG